MCGRFDVDLSNREIDKLISELPEGSPPVKSGEVFPTNNALALILRHGKPQPDVMAWGFPRWQGKGVIFNARAETALNKPLFRKNLIERPAAIPATGFYEWRTNPLLAHKEKFIFTATDQDLLYLAGCWNDFPQNGAGRCFTLLTAAADSFIREYHDRMPVILRQSEIEPWLKGENRAEILARREFPLTSAPV